MFALSLLLACILIAAWPLLKLPSIRPLLAGAAGSGCMALGATLVGLVTSGFLQMPLAASTANAAENLPTVEKSTPSKSPDATSSDPEIESTSPDTVVIPLGRPDWVEKEPNLSGEVHTIAVSSGPFKRESDCSRALAKEMVKATREYIVDQLGSDLAAQFIRYDAATIQKRFVKPSNIYHEEITVSFGTMHQTHALLEFDVKFRKELEGRWAKVRGASRLSQLGLFAGAGLLLIGSIFGYFRLDNATRGYYTGRLQFVTAAAILAVVGAGAVVAQWITWL